ncbi:SDR family NAD(P)-dependent oxidoreductase [Niveibacterium sp.]|uniref:SDR family NAD(P)-dependent oxidoreductase n=1 Tax=Niveibacterium sp. TaxID=2017444 RepID=UPI0035B00451
MSAFARYPSLEGRRVLITGGATGIGAALVEAFAGQGAQVGFLDIDADAGAALQARLPGTRFAAADVRDIPALQSAIDLLAEQLGGVEVLINNAANDARHAFDEVTPELWDNALAVNLRHHFFAAQRVAPLLRAAGGGSIINLGSVSWMRGRPGFAGYSTSKAAINGLTRTLARELGADGIRVNALVPGAIRTERQARLWRTPDEDAKFLELQALKLHLQPEHVARMALFLAADDSNGCSGQNFIVDAGLV